MRHRSKPHFISETHVLLNRDLKFLILCYLEKITPTGSAVLLTLHVPATRKLYRSTSIFFPPLDPILVMLYIFVSAFCIKQSKNLEIHNSELPDFKVLPSLQTTFLVRAAKCARQNSPVSVHSEGGTNYTSTDYW